MHIESFIRQAAEMAEIVGVVPLVAGRYVWVRGKLESRYRGRHAKRGRDEKG